MSNWDPLLGTVGFIFLWPWALIALAALIVCGVYTEAEYEEGVLTFGGKRMVRSRIALGVGCGIYWLSLTLRDFWAMHWQALLLVIAVANVSLLLAAFYGIQARGSRRVLMRIATLGAAISSTMTTLMLISNIGPA